MQTVIDDAIKALESRGTILYPTDTIWGIGCDAFDAEAIKKVYAIKQRDESKNLLWLVRKEWVAINNDGCQGLLINNTRPTTVIVDKRLIKIKSPTLTAEMWQKVMNNESVSTIGLRIPRHIFCQELLKGFGRPVTSTSANISGETTAGKYEEIKSVIKQSVDYAVPYMAENESGEKKGSRIVMLDADGEIKIIRE